MLEQEKDMTKKSFDTTGRTMLWIGWGIALVILTWIFAGIEESLVNPNSEPESQIIGDSRQVILKQNQYNHYVVTGKINQHEVIFFLDTGATSVSVPQSVAQKIGLKRGYSYPVNTANGTINVYQTTIDELTIGNIVLRNIDASINPYMEGDEILLGMSALKQVDFYQQKGTLTLIQK